MLKQGGEWRQVDWQTALEYVANGLKGVKDQHGAKSIGALVSPHSTLEELFLATGLLRGLGSDNIDSRLRNAEFGKSEGVRWLGLPIAALTQLQRVLVVGSNLRKDHPLYAQRLRQAVRHGAQLNAITSKQLLKNADAWAIRLANAVLSDAGQWAQALANVAAAIAAEKGVTAPAAGGQATPEAQAIAKSLLGGERKAVLLGNAAAHAANASSLLALANWIGSQTGASVGYLGEAANTVGAQWVGAQPQGAGLNAGQMLAGGLKAAVLLQVEPEDTAAGAAAAAGLNQAEMVVTLSPFKTNLAFSDVLLPIAPFSETSGSFVNAEGRVQSFHAVVKPLGETRPAWKVLRVLGNLLGLNGFDFESSQEVLAAASAKAPNLSNATQAAISLAAPAVEPVSASIYQLDGLVRRAPSLQLTADAREGVTA
jgi:NADH-quinone oxidoreductase subunit G